MIETPVSPAPRQRASDSIFATQARPWADTAVRDRVTATEAWYIKLGEGGAWEAEALRDDVLLLGYTNVPDVILHAADSWTDATDAAVKKVFLDPPCNNAGRVASDKTRQVKRFYTADESVIWCTFIGQQLYWCHAEKAVERLADGRHTRRAKGGWSNEDRFGNTLEMRRLSGKLTKSASYRQTICSIQDLEYLLIKLNGEDTAAAQQVKVAQRNLTAALSPVIENLDPYDFEILADLIFRASGWQLDSVRGGHMKDIDLDLSSPLTGARSQAQVKSKAGTTEFDKLKRDTDGLTLEHVYLVVHELDGIDETHNEGVVEVIGPRRLAELSTRLGLAEWLIHKAS
jgi:hypothetical protein